MNTYRKERLINIARSLQPARTGRNLHVSFILKNNQLLITSTNSYTKQHPHYMFGPYVAIKISDSTKYVAGLHSEIGAIKGFINRFGHSDFTGLTLFNVRVSSKGETMLAKPCLNCQRVLNSFNFKNIEYT